MLNAFTNLLLLAGPVLSRFDRFLLTGPSAKWGLALRLITTTNLHFVSKLIVSIVPARGPVFFKVF